MRALDIMRKRDLLSKGVDVYKEWPEEWL